MTKVFGNNRDVPSPMSLAVRVALVVGLSCLVAKGAKTAMALILNCGNDCAVERQQVVSWSAYVLATTIAAVLFYYIFLVPLVLYARKRARGNR